jgi:hypothetical protein
MIFYIATDKDGRKHVLTVHGEALKIDKHCVEIDQPNDKASLKKLIQESFDHIHLLEQKISSLLDQQIEDIDTSDIPEEGEEFFEKATLRQPAPAPAAPAAAVATQTSWTATQIEDFILNEASINQVANIHSCLGTRFAELIKETK